MWVYLSRNPAPFYQEGLCQHTSATHRPQFFAFGMADDDDDDDDDDADNEIPDYDEHEYECGGI